MNIRTRSPRVRKSCFRSRGDTPVYRDGKPTAELVGDGDRANLSAGELELAFLLGDARQHEHTFARLYDVQVEAGSRFITLTTVSLSDVALTPEACDDPIPRRADGL